MRACTKLEQTYMIDTNLLQSYFTSSFPGLVKLIGSNQYEPLTKNLFQIVVDTATKICDRSRY